MAFGRKKGISLLLACQNEEAMVATSIRSFLDFADELVVVDNGSTDGTKDIVRELQALWPDKIRFYDEPNLPDLYHNRQFALERSSHEWIVRADADFVAYTEGVYDIMRMREYLLSGGLRRLWPWSVSVPLPNVTGDLWHTGVDHPPSRPAGAERIPNHYIPPAVTGHGLRIYRYLPGFSFRRIGRLEGERYRFLYRRLGVRWDGPLWMHCNLKTNRHHFFRSERTNWREQGDFERFPTLLSYVESIITGKYETEDINKAADLYMRKNVLPYLIPYDPEKHYPYPALVEERMRTDPVYRVRREGEGRVRERVAAMQ